MFGPVSQQSSNCFQRHFLKIEPLEKVHTFFAGARNKSQELSLIDEVLGDTSNVVMLKNGVPDVYLYREALQVPDGREGSAAEAIRTP